VKLQFKYIKISMTLWLLTEPFLYSFKMLTADDDPVSGKNEQQGMN